MKREKSIVRAGMHKIIILVFALAALFLVLDAFFLKQFIFADPAKNPDTHFKDCRILQKDCVDVTKCGLNVYCGDGNYETCYVYDCGASYGVFTKDAAGNVNFKNEDKPNDSVADSTRDACGGTLQILSENCVEGKTEIRVKLKTQGECEIEGFATLYGRAGAQHNSFTSLGDGVYSITVDVCGKMTEIIPAAKGGIGLNLNQI